MPLPSSVPVFSELIKRGGRIRKVARLCAMGEWVTAVIGLLGAGAGAGAAMWGANRAARMSQEALVVQIRREDERWKRDQRQAAYHAMLQAVVAQLNAAQEVAGRADHDPVALPDEVEAVRHAAAMELVAAMLLIELCGPQAVIEAAQELQHRSTNIVQSRARSARGLPPAHIYQSYIEAERQFKSAARAALGFTEGPALPDRQSAG